MEGYEVLNISAWRSFAVGRKNKIMLRADILNVMGESYEIVRRYPMPGRSYRIGAELKF